jgi:hypothetical protein
MRISSFFILFNVKAINLRNEHDLGNIKLSTYEFIRLICNRNRSEKLRNETQMNLDYNVIYNDSSTRYMLFETVEEEGFELALPVI